MASEHSDKGGAAGEASVGQALQKEALEREALDWVVRMTSGEARQSDRDDFLRWRRRSPAHEAAARSAVALWRGIGQVAPLAAGRPGPTASRRLVLGGALAAGVAGIALGGASLGFVPSLAHALADHSTAAGEQRRFEPLDGVLVELNTRSGLSVEAAAGARALTLVGGEAAFTVRNRPGTDLRLAAGRSRLVAVDGLFVVRMNEDEVRITCLDGTVDVLQPRFVRLARGQAVVCSGTDLGAPVPADAEAAAAWRQGRLVFRNEPLQKVAAELNRYLPGLVLVIGEAAARRRVTGIFHLARMDEALDHIRDALAIRVRRMSPYLTLIG